VSLRLPPPPKFSTRENFVPSEPVLRGEPRGAFFPMFFCYFVECSDGSYYVGVTEDPARRLQEHNQGRGSAWIAARRPAKLVWTEAHPTLSSARQRENQIKRWNHTKKKALIGGSLRLRSGQAPAENA
jgi:putative endonuclease